MAHLNTDRYPSIQVVLLLLNITVSIAIPVQNTDAGQKIRLEDIENDNLKSEQEAKRSGFRTSIGATNDVSEVLGKLLGEQPGGKSPFPLSGIQLKPPVGGRPFQAPEKPFKNNDWIPLTKLTPPIQPKPSQPILPLQFYNNPPQQLQPQIQTQRLQQQQPIPPPLPPSGNPIWNQPLTHLPILQQQYIPMTLPYHSMTLPQLFFLQNKGFVDASALQQPSNDLNDPRKIGLQSRGLQPLLLPFGAPQHLPLVQQDSVQANSHILPVQTQAIQAHCLNRQ